MNELKKYINTDYLSFKLFIFSLIYWIINQFLINFSSINLNTIFSLNSKFIIFLIKPWTFITFIFVQHSLLNTVFLFIFFYFSEQLFRTFFNEKSLLKFFILGNIFSAFIFILIGFIFPTNLILYGFYPGIYAVFYGIIAYQPKFKIQLFLFPIAIDLKIIGIVLFIFNLIPIFTSFSGSGIYIGQILGSLFGFLYMQSFEQGKDFITKLFSNKTNLKYSRKTPPRDDYEFNSQKVNNNNKKLDEILEKIAQSGYENLSKTDKEFLFNYRK